MSRSVRSRMPVPEVAKPFGRRVLTELGYWSNTALRRDDPLSESVGRLAEEWRHIFARSPEPLLRGDGLRILFVTGNGLNTSALGLESLLMTSLRVRGHHCTSLICDAGLPSCEFNRSGIGDPPAGRYGTAFSQPALAAMCRSCSNAADAAIRATGSEPLPLGRFGRSDDYPRAQAISASIDPNDIRSFVYGEVAVGDHAFSSTLRQTLRGTIDFADAEDLWTYRRQLLSAIVMVDRLSRCLDQLLPDKVVLVHGVYLTHGVAAELAGKRDIDVTVYGVPYRKGTVWLSHKETYHRSIVTESRELWEDLELTPEMSASLDEYLASKTAGGRDNVNYHPSPVVAQDAIVKELGLDLDRPVISVFTNVIWDAQIYYQHNAFSDIFDWLYSTIEYFASREQLQLVIRIHPAETKGGLWTRQPLMADLEQRFPTLPNNVSVIRSESAISSYTVADMSAAALIYGTKMGLEIAARGIPVVVAGETFNRGKGFTYDVETRQQYFSLLDRIEDLPRNSDVMVERARKFAYYLFFMRMIDMPLVSGGLHQVIRPSDERFFTFDSLDALALGRCPNLDAICDGIINGTPFVVPPSRAITRTSGA